MGPSSRVSVLGKERKRDACVLRLVGPLFYDDTAPMSKATPIKKTKKARINHIRYRLAKQIIIVIKELNFQSLKIGEE